MSPTLSPVATPLSKLLMQVAIFGNSSERQRLAAPFQPIAEAFIGNFVRIFKSGTFPFAAMQAMGQYERTKPELGPSQIPEDADSRLDDHFWEQLRAASKESRLTFDGERILSVVHEELYDEWIEHLFSMLVIQSWSAFETLCGDLWVAAVNGWPSRLASLRGRGNRIRDLAGASPPTEESAERRQDSESTRRLSLRDIAKVTKGSYDLSGRMGDLLVESHRVYFTTLNDIREAYSLAFSDNAGAIDKWLSQKNLDGASLVRNLLMHKSGVVDEMFAKQAKVLKFFVRLPEVGERFQWGLEYPLYLVEPCFSCGANLLEGVDAWIKRESNG